MTVPPFSFKDGFRRIGQAYPDVRERLNVALCVEEYQSFHNDKKSADVII